MRQNETPKCSHPDCTKPAFTLGLPHGWLCWRHYDYWTKEEAKHDPEGQGTTEVRG